MARAGGDLDLSEVRHVEGWPEVEDSTSGAVCVTLLTHMIGCSKWDLDTPALLLDLAVMERNIDRMATTFRAAGVNWRPHTKAIKVPQLAYKLMDAGAHGITCAKLGEAEVMAAAGISNILIANQIVGDTKIARLIALLDRADVIVAVDNADNVRALGAAASGAGKVLPVVIEVDLGMNRAGVQPGADTLALARLISECPGLRFAGLMGWEGQTIRIADREEKQRAVAAAVKLLTDSAGLCREQGLPVEIVSCGGTGTYQFTANLPGVTELQAGGGIFGDMTYREYMHVDHECAVTVLATVTSRPVSTRIITDTGKKTMSSDSAVPVPLIVPRVASVGLSAEHAAIKLVEPDTAIKIGDKIEFVVGYTDTTTMLHDEIYALRDGRVEVVWQVAGRGKLR
jgi:D-serine deaminase-like pyridoxal phosphate-dependent protein